MTELLEVLDDDRVAFGGFGHYKRTLENGYVKSGEAFGIKCRLGSVERLGLHEILLEVCGNPQKQILADIAKPGIGEGQFLCEHADQTSLGHTARFRGFHGEIQPAKNPFPRVGQLAEGRVLKFPRLSCNKFGDGRLGDFILALEIVEEAAFRDPRLGADVVEAGGVEAAGAHQVDAGLDEAAFGLGQFDWFHLRFHTD